MKFVKSFFCFEEAFIILNKTNLPSFFKGGD